MFIVDIIVSSWVLIVKHRVGTYGNMVLSDIPLSREDKIQFQSLLSIFFISNINFKNMLSIFLNDKPVLPPVW